MLEIGQHLGHMGHEKSAICDGSIKLRAGWAKSASMGQALRRHANRPRGQCRACARDFTNVNPAYGIFKGRLLREQNHGQTQPCPQSSSTDMKTRTSRSGWMTGQRIASPRQSRFRDPGGPSRLSIVPLKIVPYRAGSDRQIGHSRN